VRNNNNNNTRVWCTRPCCKVCSENYETTMNSALNESDESLLFQSQSCECHKRSESSEQREGCLVTSPALDPFLLPAVNWGTGPQGPKSSFLCPMVRLCYMEVVNYVKIVFCLRINTRTDNSSGRVPTALQVAVLQWRLHGGCQTVWA
jgi:hypothetical protein